MNDTDALTIPRGLAHRLRIAQTELTPERHQWFLWGLTEAADVVLADARRRDRRQHERQARKLNTPALASVISTAVLNGEGDEHREALAAVIARLGTVAEIRWRRGALRQVLGIDPDEYLV